MKHKLLNLLNTCLNSSNMQFLQIIHSTPILNLKNKDILQLENSNLWHIILPKAQYCAMKDKISGSSK